ncbi:MAG: hypothetical protein MI725_10675 [Pirellulales bacterium]|nr:hypothetical protein [Pirellulales bacterium]
MLKEQQTIKKQFLPSFYGKSVEKLVEILTKRYQSWFKHFFSFTQISNEVDDCSNLRTDSRIGSPKTAARGGATETTLPVHRIPQTISPRLLLEKKPVG